MIELGLQRISRLVQVSPIPLSFKAIHVAGTNGKGSITSYISSLLTTAGIRCGSFTSPHLIDRWDCITINGRAVRKSLFLRVEEQIKALDRLHGIGATEFELFTATAFQIFEQEKIDVGVIEVGLGGRLDATNVLPAGNVLVSVISKIGLDHQKMLGDTLVQIAKEKAGIIKAGIPYVVIDATNDEEVLQAVKDCADGAGVTMLPVTTKTASQSYPELTSLFDSLGLEEHQRVNASVAVTATQQALARLPKTSTTPVVSDLSRFFPQAITSCPCPGRQQQISLHPLVSRTTPVLLDGAHNPQSADVLSRLVETKLRRRRGDKSSSPVTWVLAVSHGKAVGELLDILIPIGSGDNVAAVEFGAVDGMPWVKACDSGVINEHVHGIPGIGKYRNFGKDVQGALEWAAQTAGDQEPMVVAGSLYLMGDVLRRLRQAKVKGDGEEEVD